MKILLTGVTGQVGWELHRTLSVLSDVVVADRESLNLADRDAIARVVREVRPSVIVNPAAYTAVDRAEAEPDLAMAINGTAPGILAEEANAIGAGLIHFSTDYVFDGEKTEPYAETDLPNPLSIYGKTKLEGERVIQEVAGRFLILRTSWIYANRGRNFLRTIQRLARERSEMQVVDDQRGSPTWARMVAEAVGHIVRQCQTLSAWPTGLYHLTCAGETTWCGFARAITRKCDTPVNVLPIDTSSYPTPARRPRNSILRNDKVTSTFSLVMPHWEATLELCLNHDSVPKD